MNKGREEVNNNDPKQVSTNHKPRVSYPKVMTKDRIEEQFGKFVKLLKKLHINLPFIEVLSQMPNSAKFLRELLINKRKLDATSHVELNIVCSAILKNELPNKLKDPGSFVIPCLIGSLSVNNALVDLGASINVMPYKMFKRLGLGKPKQTRMSIQLVDKIVRFPKGIIEDDLVKIDKFIYPVDFVILDMDEDNEVPLIFRRPFLATGRTIINVGIEELTIRVGDDAVTLPARDSIKTSKTQDNVMKLIDDKTNIQLFLQEPTRTKTTEAVHYYQVENKNVHEK
ncbi:hypothetical protein PVK06_047229 [Gossypium arboreum]|uniref:Uncharacterized protein n=1 Tax=Gossypium arboreum TaxID=29729 RepID=A0ABR0MCR3_GOSAR|nr:hypothetical protein PVK06_047229 [Gossypium arboreum]